MLKTISSIRKEYLDTEFFRAPENILSQNKKYTFITYMVAENLYNQLFNNVVEEYKALKSTTRNGDVIVFCKRDKQVTCHNKTIDERVAFIAI